MTIRRSVDCDSENEQNNRINKNDRPIKPHFPEISQQFSLTIFKNLRFFFHHIPKPTEKADNAPRRKVPGSGTEAVMDKSIDKKVFPSNPGEAAYMRPLDEVDPTSIWSALLLFLPRKQ